MWLERSCWDAIRVTGHQQRHLRAELDMTRYNRKQFCVNRGSNIKYSWWIKEVILFFSLLLQLQLQLKVIYRPSDLRLKAKLVPTFADRGCHVVSATDPYGLNLGFLDHVHVWVRESPLCSEVIYHFISKLCFAMNDSCSVSHPYIMGVVEWFENCTQFFSLSMQ
jgi:hypothetical protein